MSITHGMRSTPHSLSKLKPEQGRDVLKNPLHTLCCKSAAGMPVRSSISWKLNVDAREPKQQHKMYFSRACLFTASEQSLCTAAQTHPTWPPTQGARSFPSGMNCHAPFGKPGCLKECYFTQRSNCSTVDQLAEHQKHVKIYKDQTGLTKPGLALHFCKANPVPFELREPQHWTASWVIHKFKHNWSHWKEIKHNPWH